LESAPVKKRTGTDLKADPAILLKTHSGAETAFDPEGPVLPRRARLNVAYASGDFCTRMARVRRRLQREKIKIQGNHQMTTGS